MSAPAPAAWWDAADLLSKPTQPIGWLVDGILPTGTVGDVFGPPGEGKSTILLHLAMTIATDAGNWFGCRCASGRVAILGGEKSSEGAAARDLHRVWRGRGIEPGQLKISQQDEPLWRWDRLVQGWVLTEVGQQETASLAVFQPVLVLLDTTMAVAAGGDQIDNVAQYSLGKTIQRWARDLGGASVLGVSHTNQASAKESAAWRLNYLSRAGGNGLPGALRWLAGVTRIRPDDDLAKLLGLEDEVARKKLVAFGVSKNNEIPTPTWNPHAPAVFEIKEDGSLLLVRDGREVAVGDVLPIKKGRRREQF